MLLLSPMVRTFWGFNWFVFYMWTRKNKGSDGYFLSLDSPDKSRTGYAPSPEKVVIDTFPALLDSFGESICPNGQAVAQGQ